MVGNNEGQKSEQQQQRNGRRGWGMGGLLWPNSLKKQDSGLSYDVDPNNTEKLKNKRSLLDDDDISLDDAVEAHNSNSSSNDGSTHGGLPNNALSYDEDSDDELEKIVENDNEEEQESRSLSSSSSINSKSSAKKVRGLWGRLRGPPKAAIEEEPPVRKVEVEGGARLLDKPVEDDDTIDTADNYRKEKDELDSPRHGLQGTTVSEITRNLNDIYDDESEDNENTILQQSDSNVTEMRSNTRKVHDKNKATKDEEDEKETDKNHAEKSHDKTNETRPDNSTKHEDEEQETTTPIYQNSIEGIGSVDPEADNTNANNNGGIFNIFKAMSNRRIKAKMDLNPELLTQEEIQELQKEISNNDDGGKRSSVKMDQMETKITENLERVDITDSPDKITAWKDGVNKVTSAAFAPDVFVDKLIDPEEEGDKNMGFYREVELGADDEEMDAAKEGLKPMNVGDPPEEGCFEYLMDAGIDLDDDLLYDNGGYRKVLKGTTDSDDEMDEVDVKQVMDMNKKLMAQVKELNDKILSLESALEDKTEEANMWKTTAVHFQEIVANQALISMKPKEDESKQKQSMDLLDFHQSTAEMMRNQ